MTYTPKGLRFRDVAINEPFDFIDPAPLARNSFFERCYKTGKRTYREFGSNRQHTVGSIHCRVFHVGLLNTYRG
jgi:hypothetical protein